MREDIRSREPKEDELDTKVIKKCVYISDTDKHKNDDNNNNNRMRETEDMELDYDHAISQLQQPYHM